ncbi:hypothetical protein FRC00_013922, partial [Tulasnella sp. 408]
MAEAGSIRFDSGRRGDYALVDVTAASIYMCLDPRHDMVTLLDSMAFQALQVAAFIIPPEAEPNKNIVHRALEGGMAPAPAVLELLRKDPDGPRAKKFRAALIIILGGCFCRCVQWDAIGTPEELHDAIRTEAERVLFDRSYEFNSPLEKQLVLKCAAQLIDGIERPSDSSAARILADFGRNELVVRARQFLMDDSSPNFGTMFPLQVLIYVLLSEAEPVLGSVSVENGVHTAILRRFWIIWDLLGFFARCLLVAERVDEVK